MTLFVVGTPIGNLGDITFRAVETLSTVSVVVAEDSRRTRQLLTHLEIRTPILSMPAFDEERRAPGILSKFGPADEIALCTDAGVPGVSDPGAVFVSLARSLGHEIVPIPGPSAVTAALSVAGIRETSFTFLGFLPGRPGRAKRALADEMGRGRTVVLFESPNRIATVLSWIAELAPGREVTVARELTKAFETLHRGTAKELAETFAHGKTKGECTVVIAPGEDSTLDNAEKTGR